jgi:Leucine-rich repeat (LRR) protein
MKFMIILLMAWPVLSSADTLISICDRGTVGKKITEALGAKSCSEVSREAMARIYDLDLASSKLDYLLPSQFEGLTSLQYLNLSSNLLDRFPLETLSTIPTLLWLDISHNNISSLPDFAFRDIRYLQRLEIQFNLLGSISTDTFSELKSLMELYLQGNAIGAIEDGAFRDSLHLYFLDLRNNKLKSVSRSKLGLDSKTSVIGVKANP